MCAQVCWEGEAAAAWYSAEVRAPNMLLRRGAEPLGCGAARATAHTALFGVVWRVPWRDDVGRHKKVSFLLLAVADGRARRSVGRRSERQSTFKEGGLEDSRIPCTDTCLPGIRTELVRVTTSTLYEYEYL